MKKRFITILVTLILASVLLACGGQKTDVTSNNEVSVLAESKYFCEIVSSQDSYLNFLESLDEADCKILDISRNEYFWYITYLSSNSIINTSSKSTNNYFCEIGTTEDSYIDFLQSLDEEKYTLFDISRNKYFWYITYKVNN